ncbi:MAG: DNA-binding protein [Negativicutes bacterium]|nr:DNA-binding protein [Negativicutes bacterium]
MNMNTCCCNANQALLTTSEAALYLGVPVSYLICARSPKCPGSLVPPPKFVRLRAEKKGAKWIRYPRVELDRWLEALPLQEKTEMTKTDISAGGELSNDKFRGCLFTLTLIKGIADANINSSLLKSLTAESAENKQNK